jgi:peptidyl-prolyl cis-trans isomerase C
MKKIHIGLLAAASVLAFAAQAQNITTVNGKAVPQSRAKELLSQIAKQGGGAQPVTPELEKKARDEVVQREIFMQEAARRGLQKTPDYLQQLEFARQAILIRALFQDEEKHTKVDDAEVKAAYDAQKALNGSKEYRARHILVEKEDEAKALIAQIKGGAKFEDLAKKNSKDPGSGENGGDLDWATPASYVPEFSAALIKLEKGQMTETPVKTQFGYHIIKLEDTRQAQFPAFEEVKQTIQQGMIKDRMGKFVNELRSKAKTDYKFSN